MGQPNQRLILCTTTVNGFIDKWIRIPIICHINFILYCFTDLGVKCESILVVVVFAYCSNNTDISSMSPQSHINGSYDKATTFIGLPVNTSIHGRDLDSMAFRNCVTCATDR
jgi:hypothetical protein